MGEIIRQREIPPDFRAMISLCRDMVPRVMIVASRMAAGATWKRMDGSLFKK